jgi:hypothetical protein
MFVVNQVALEAFDHFIRCAGLLVQKHKTLRFFGRKDKSVKWYSHVFLHFLPGLADIGLAFCIFCRGFDDVVIINLSFGFGFYGD